MNKNAGDALNFRFCIFENPQTDVESTVLLFFLKSSLCFFVSFFLFFFLSFYKKIQKKRMKAALLSYSFELVAPMAAIASILLLPLGPLLIPRIYIIFLLVYFTSFLYTQVNHIFKFYITASKMKKAIRRWADEEESALYDNSSLVHVFIVPNYAEPEALLRDTIKRLANHR